MKWTAQILLLVIAAWMTACVTSPDEDTEGARKSAETLTSLGRGYMDREQYEIALEKLKRAVVHDNTYAPAHTLLGVLYETIGEDDQAENEYRLAVKYDPTDGAANNNLGAFLCAKGRPENTDRYFDAALADPFYDTPEMALSNAGACALERGDLDKAESYLRQSLDIDARLASSLLPMAEVSYRNASYLRARAFLQRYEAVGSVTEESLNLGVEIETRLGDEASAERYRKELASRYPQTR